MEIVKPKLPTGVVKSALLATLGTPVQILGPSDKRVGLLFGPPSIAGRYTLTTDPSAALDAGLTLWNTSTAVHLTCDEYGDIVKKAWYAIPGQAATTVGFIEVVEQ